MGSMTWVVAVIRIKTVVVEVFLTEIIQLNTKIKFYLNNF
jgi:hypothetical protein